MYDEEIMKVDGFDDAIIGLAERINMQPVLAYDTLKIIEKLQQDGCTEEEAWEYYEFNILGSWVGEGTPVFITPREYLDLDI